MFALIETSGATHIAIHVPHQGAEKTLPALAAMLEQNATFINKGWRELSLRKPSMSIVLGDVLTVEDSEEGAIAIAASGAVIGADFERATPDVFLANKKQLQKLRDEIEKQRTELNYVRQQLVQANAEIERLKAEANELV
jgi:hypothetical protein